MRLALGFLLVGLALVGGYFILSGKFPPTTANSGGSSNAVPGGPEPIGQIAQSAGVGDGGASIIGRLTHLGVPAFHELGDMHASNGGYKV